MTLGAALHGMRVAAAVSALLYAVAHPVAPVALRLGHTAPDRLLLRPLMPASGVTRPRRDAPATPPGCLSALEPRVWPAITSDAAPAGRSVAPLAGKTAPPAGCLCE
jgi:hypothetical protein